MRGLFLILPVAAAACGGSNVSPAGPAAPLGPIASLSVTVDNRTPAMAIAGFSTVAFDAGASTGVSVLEFGDGTTSVDALSKHVYSSPGTYTATLTVADSHGRRATATQTIVVKSMAGAWFYGGYNRAVGRFELRRLTITDQNGSSVRGSFAASGVPEKTFTGSLAGDRRIRIVLDDQSVQLEGVVPNAINEDGGSWSLQVQGGSAGGQTLPFVPIIGEATGSPPRATLVVQAENASTPTPIAGFSKVVFDATGSTGDRLSYVMEFGDDEIGAESASVRPVNRSGRLIARVTVVDRFGRYDTVARGFDVVSLADGISHFRNFFRNPQANRYESRELFIDTQSGSNVSGTYTNPEGSRFHFTGTLTGERDVRLTLDSGTAEFTGQFTSVQLCSRAMRLVMHGGSADGQTLDFSSNTYYSAFCNY